MRRFNLRAPKSLQRPTAREEIWWLLRSTGTYAQQEKYAQISSERYNELKLLERHVRKRKRETNSGALTTAANKLKTTLRTRISQLVLNQ